MSGKIFHISIHVCCKYHVQYIIHSVGKLVITNTNKLFKLLLWESFLMIVAMEGTDSHSILQIILGTFKGANVQFPKMILALR